MKNLHLIIIGSLILFSSCTKEPVACIAEAPEEITVFEIIELSAGCSANSTDYEWTTSTYYDKITKSGETAKFSWEYPGLKDVTLSVQNEKGEEQSITKSVNVVDVCYECITSDTSLYYYAESLMICSGDIEAASISELQQFISMYESIGFACSKK